MTNTLPEHTRSYPEKLPAATRGVTGKTVIEAANEAVTVEEIASEVTHLTGSGERLRGRCPVHDGTNLTSFSVSPSNGLFYCHSCGEGGDAVRLTKLLRDYERDDQAAAELLLERGLEIPSRPDRWFHRQARQKPVRDALGRNKAAVLRRRLFRVAILPLIDASISDADEHDAEVKRAWREFAEIPDGIFIEWYEQGKRGERDAA